MHNIYQNIQISLHYKQELEELSLFSLLLILPIYSLGNNLSTRTTLFKFT